MSRNLINNLKTLRAYIETQDSLAYEKYLDDNGSRCVVGCAIELIQQKPLDVEWSMNGDNVKEIYVSDFPEMARYFPEEIMSRLQGINDSYDNQLERKYMVLAELDIIIKELES